MYNGKVEHEEEGLVLRWEARRYGISKRVEGGPVGFGEDAVVLQYDVKFSKGHGCSGGYLKFLSEDPEFKEEDLTDKTGYSVMFGPDKCGDSGKVHLIIRYKDRNTGEFEEKHLKNPPGIPTADGGSHVFTAVILPDNTYKVLIDDVVEQEGSLFEDFEPSFLPPKMIDDATDSKPEDWVDEPQFPDPDATKPDDWDEDAPAKIPDADATKPADWDEDMPLEVTDPEAEVPEDWDEDEDGDWEAPTIPNPACKKISGCGPWTPPLIPNPDYKGKWMRPYIDNPDYKGPWAPRQIDNPDYYEDDTPLKSVAPIGAVALEIWAMDGGIIFDNILISTNEEHSKEVIETYWKPKNEAEKAERAKMATEANKHQHLAFWRGLLETVDPFLIEHLPPNVVDMWMAAKEFLLNNLVYLYAVIGLIPTLLVISCFIACTREKSSASDDVAARKKKTDEPTADDEDETGVEEIEEEEEEEEEEKVTRRKGRKTRA
ncbi:calnexin [Chloropicon primus]|uniref:Calnexin n=1 Tax=Chloropicon primus TaxID=1764295 RepID=A0A5B8MYM8_9CHLO|nr:calnexin [Chloropicon primus]UPR04873.1 calnexin [Chloropicon primus]|eukprot:QDZ25677.1 calnexin [Chloropicon primus]